MFKENSCGEVMVDRDTFLSWLELLGSESVVYKFFNNASGKVYGIKLSNGVEMNFLFTLLDVRKDGVYYGRQYDGKGNPGYNMIRFQNSSQAYHLMGKGSRNPESWKEAMGLIDLLKQ